MNIVVGVTSGIACYKVVDLVSKLKEDFNVNVIMTENSLKLISAREFFKATGNKVAVKLFNPGFNYRDYIKNNKRIKHISLADKADLIVIAPATADIIGKIANGIADDLLSTTVIASSAPKLICPSMNVKMWQNPIVQDNVKKLKKLGYYFIDPENGMLACGYKGVGRLANIKRIYTHIRLIMSKRDLVGKKILITAGPTQEEIDPVRVITNKSSGKMGYSIATAASLRGADVILVTGPTNLESIANVKVIDVKNTSEMYMAVKREFSSCDVFISAAAVSDFKIKKSKDKIKKKEKMVLKLDKNIDILKEISKKKSNKKLIGFALETKDLVKNALKKLKEKNLDLIVANSTKTLGKEKSDFMLIDHKLKRKFLNTSKLDIANKILDTLK